MVLRWYKYLFYRLYSWRLSRPSPISDPELDAALLIAMANSLYIIAIVELFAAFSRPLQQVLFDNGSRTKILAFFFAIVFALMHGYIFAWSGNAKKMTKEFRKNKDKPSKRGTIAVICYFVFSYIFLIGFGILLYPTVRAHLP